MKEIILSPAAFADAEESRSWYELRKTGLGGEYLRALDECLLQIQASPERFRLIRGEFSQVPDAALSFQRGL